MQQKLDFKVVLEMAKHIALAGKGGTGKTTTATLLIRYMIEKKKVPILAVDADPNANLNEALGYKIENTIASILDDIKKDNVPLGMTKDMYLEMMLNKALTETEHVDLLVMGGPQGPGCYCYPTDLLKRHIETLDKNYKYMVIDNEAGLEHISRGVIQGVDTLLIVSDATVRGIRTAGRIYELAKNLKTDIGDAYLIVTRIEDPVSLENEIRATGIELLGTIPFDPLLYEQDLEGKPLLGLPESSPAVQASRGMFEKLSF